MNSGKTGAGHSQQIPLRLWSGIVIVILQFLVRFGIPVFVPGAMEIGVFGGLLGGLAIIIWWVFFSRATRFERWIAILLMIAALAGTSQIIHQSIGTAMMGMMFVIYSIPVLSVAFVTWAISCGRLSYRPRVFSMITTILLASGFWYFLRTDGLDGEGHNYFSWRWAMTPEDRLLAQRGDMLLALPADSAEMGTVVDWSGFRGVNRDGIVHGVRIATDWAKSPPVEMWRRSVGPGCSSFAIHGALLYTQEQRGEFEMVTCYNLETGDPVWFHGDSTRFWDSHAGAGPRSTPTLSNGRVYTSGATGMLDVLDARSGAVIWTRNAALDTDIKLPVWGFTGSPLVVDNLVIVAIAGKLLAYDILSGNQRWYGPDGGSSYSSPQLMTINGTSQLIFVGQKGITAFVPSDGKILWEHKWEGVRIIQPAMINETDILVCAGDRKGLARFTIKNVSGKWTLDEKWRSASLRPDFNDFVVHKAHVYGFDGPGIACIDIENGRRKWKGGHYGSQLILLADQDMILVLSEKGELALVMASPEQFMEIANFPAIEGKTWNHPVLVGDVLLVRNSGEMAAFRIPLAGS